MMYSLPDGAADNLRADGWADPEEARVLESRITILRRAAEVALSHLRRARLAGSARDSILLATARAEGELGSALNTLDASKEVR